MSRLIHRDIRKDPPLALRGEGIFLHDSNGRSIIDGSGGAAVACLGHGHPRVLEAMRAQMERLTYAHHLALFERERGGAGRPRAER
jgi:adenosylmethionine-8-amino-7-oxononanoate aminotransferase